MKVHDHTHGYEYWYDRASQSWWGAKFRRKGGRQLTPALVAADKETLIAYINEEIKENEGK